MKTFRRVALVAGTAVLALTPASANHSWGGYHWAGDGSELPIKVNTSITSQWTSVVGTAISDWNSSNEIDLTSQTSSRDPKKCSPIAGQVLVCNASYGRRGWLGIATIWLSNGHISQATTKLNDTYHNSAPYNQAAWRMLVACQEIGHDWGLDHQDENFDNPNLGTCMDYTSNPLGPPANTHPNSHDYQELNLIYDHDDGFTTSSAATDFGIRQVGRAVPQRPPSAGIGDSPAEWGQAIRFDRKGRPDVFLKDYGNGHRAMTHVFWAIGEGPH